MPDANGITTITVTQQVRGYDVGDTKGAKEPKAYRYIAVRADERLQAMWAAILAETERSASSELRWLIRWRYMQIKILKKLGLWPPRDVVDDWPGEEPGESENDDAGVS